MNTETGLFTYDGATSRMYRNGTLIGTLALTKNTINNADLFKLGLTETGSGTFFNGAIDDLKIYNTALSDAQVSAAYVPPTTPTAIYTFPFDNSYSATVGTGTFTSNTGTSFTADRNGNANGAVNINNTGLSATLSGLSYGSVARTVSMWVKLNAMRVDYNYLYTYGTGTNGGYDGASITGTSALGFTPSHSATLTNVVSTWYQFVFTYDGTSSRIYQNGTLISTLALTKNTQNNANLFKLGLTELGSGTFFNGAIDDLSIYNYALSNAEVSAVYNGTVSTNDVATASNPIGVYPNPTANQISFSEVTNVQLHNVVGQVITNQKNVNSLDLSAQPAGMYLATFTDDKGKVLQVSKIVKK